MRYKACLDEQRSATKEILTEIERVVKKYNITPEEYHIIRSLIKSKMFRISNSWHKFLGSVVDAKFNKKINEDGEKLETHLKNGNNKPEQEYNTVT